MLPVKDAQQLEAARTVLVHRIQLADGVLLKELCSRGVLTEQEALVIQNTRGKFNQVGKLIDIISHGDTTTLQEFTAALRVVGDDELVEECFGEDTRTAGPQTLPKVVGGETTRKPTASAAEAQPGPVVTPRQKQPEVTMQKSYRTSTGPQLMSDSHKEMITKNYDTLVNHLIVDKVLDKLFCENIITLDEKEEIQMKDTRAGKAGSLLKLVLKREDRAFSVLVEACKQYNMPHLAGILEGKGDNTMSEEDQELLQTRRPQLVEKISLETGLVLANLRAREAITQQQEEYIKNLKGNSRQVGELLDVLSRGDADTIDKLIYSLQQFGQSAVATSLLQTQKSEIDVTSRSAGPGCSDTSAQADSDLLEQQRHLLMGSINLGDGQLLAQLRARGIITADEEAIIKEQGGNSNKVGLVVNFILRRLPDAMDEFIHSLERTGQSGIVNRYLRPARTADTLSSDPVVQRGVTIHAQGPTRQQLQETLRSYLLNYIENDPSKILPGSDTGDYLIQPIIADIETDGQTDRHDATDMIRLLETSPTGQRIFLYGTAGMGKSTLCRNLARSWIERDSGLGDRYDYLIPIPLRSVRSRNLVDVICDDVKLVPRLFKERLQEEMAFNPGKVLFILDSFEEFVHSGEKEDINKLIKGTLPSDLSFLENSVVLITSRPHPEVTDLEQKVSPRISAQLQELPEQLIDKYIDSFPNLEQNDKTTIRQRFGGTFLKRPINLWLFCYVMVTIAKAGGNLIIPTSQTILLNLIVQHILLAYLKKKNLKSFRLTKSSPLSIPGLASEVKLLLREAGKLCCTAVKENTTLMKVTGEIVSTDDLLALGLFAAGADDNTVVLPHQLFKEYLAALYLSSEEMVRNDLLKQIEDQSFFREMETEHSSGPAPAHSSPRPCLVDILRSKGFDNVVRFLVGLLPATANQLTNLFVIKQSGARIVTKLTGPGLRAKEEENKRERDNMHSFLHYEIDLLQECSHEITKLTIAKALLDAEVIPDDGHSDYVPNRGSHLLLNYLTADERERFLAKFYNCQLPVIDGRPVLKVLGGDSSFFCDSFVAGFIVLHNCVVESASEELSFRRAHLPVQIIAHNMADVGMLNLKDCMLYRDKTEFVTSLGLKDSPTNDMSEELATISQSVVGLLGVYNVRGLRQLTSQYVMPATRGLGVRFCDVTLAEFRQTFPAVSLLRLGGYDKDFLSAKTAWPSVKILTLTSFIDPIDLTDVHQSFPGLEKLVVSKTTVLTDDRQTDPQTLRQLTLKLSHLKHKTVSLSREKAFKILSRSYPQTEVVLEYYKDEADADYQLKFNKAVVEAHKSIIP